MRYFLPLALLICAIPTLSQTNENNRILVQSQTGTQNSACPVSNQRIEKAALEKLNAEKDCSWIPAAEYIDFDKYSLITYRLVGDCKILGAGHITVDHESKKFMVHLSNYWGRCRAAGSFSGWMMIDKIPDDYNLEFKETKVDSEVRSDKEGRPAEILPYVVAEEADLESCVSLVAGEIRTISNSSGFLSAIRKDGQLDKCKAAAAGLEFDKYAYIGIRLNTGYCRKPEGFGYRVSEFGGSKVFLVDIRYIKPVAVCRALSRYDLWLRVPNPKTPYSVRVRTRTYRSSK